MDRYGVLEQGGGGGELVVGGGVEHLVGEQVALRRIYSMNSVRGETAIGEGIGQGQALA